MPPVDEKSLAELLARFGQTDAAERVVAALRYLAPATAGAGSDGPLTTRRRCKPR